VNGTQPSKHAPTGQAGAIPQIAEKNLFYPERAFDESLSRDNLLLNPALSGLFEPSRHHLHMRILVTGASGFVGSLLVPQLLSDGHTVRALARDEARIDAAPGVEALSGDVLTGEGLAPALDDVEVAYYLIHSMERASTPTSVVGQRTTSFPERERVGAENFAAAAANAGLQRIVYLGGPVPSWDAPGKPAATSRHLASREAVEHILLDAIPDSVALRASIVIGARSRSFRFLVRLVERMPVLTLPSWHSHRSRPIDERDIIEMLTAAATVTLDRTLKGGRSLDVGGPEILTYGEMLQRIADSMLLGRPTVGLGLNATPIAAPLAAAIAREDPELVSALMESLQGDLLPAGAEGRAHLDAAELLEVDLHSFDSAVEHALREWEQTEPLAAR
jgi:uncharacterized protein YbjT (DUF2867 family)